MADCFVNKDSYSLVQGTKVSVNQKGQSITSTITSNARKIYENTLSDSGIYLIILRVYSSIVSSVTLQAQFTTASNPVVNVTQQLTNGDVMIAAIVNTGANASATMRQVKAFLNTTNTSAATYDLQILKIINL